MPLYTIRVDGLVDGLTETFKQRREEDYNVGDQVYFGEEGGEVIYDMNGEVVNTTFPRPVYGTVVAKE